MRIEFLDNLPQDKLVHGFIGVEAFTIAFCFLAWYSSDPTAALIASSIFSIVLGIGIEVVQKITGWGKFEWLDAIAVWKGAAFPALCVAFVI